METDERLLHLLGIARRAGKLDLGSEAAKNAVRRRRAKLVLLASGLSRHTAESIGAEAEKTGVRVAGVRVTMEQLEAALGKRTGVIAVNDTGFARALLTLGAEERGGMNQ